MTVEVAPYAPRTVLETLLSELPTSEFPDALIKPDDKTAATLVQQLPSLNESILVAKPVWRDTFALTGSLRTFYASASIMKVWPSTCASRDAKNFAFVPGRIKPVKIGQNQWVDIQFTFKMQASPSAYCRGILSLICDKQGTWKIWLIRTVLDRLEGTPSVDELTWVESGKDASVRLVNDIKRAHGANGVDTSKQSPSKIYDCVIVGAGQAGLSSAGRLEALGVSSYVVLDRNDKIGDNWMNRYDSARLHTSREFSHLPFDRTFSGYQEFLTKHDLAKGYQDWARRAGIESKIWLSTNLESGSWDEQGKTWTLQIKCGETKTIQARNIIMAVGGGGQTPNMPNLPGQADFQGAVLHSADYKSSDLWKGKAAIVVGTANTAHDVAKDMVEAGLSSITMIQRARTYVMPAEHFKTFSDVSYNTDVPTSEADFESFSAPYAVTRLISNGVLHHMASLEPARFDALEAVGFRVERYGDIWYQICEKSGGHYMDVGCSEMISKGFVS